MSDTDTPAEEPEDAGDDELHAPAELVELHEVLEWQAALEEEQDG